MQLFAMILIGVAVHYLAERAERAHVGRKGQILDPAWPHAFIELVDDTANECLLALQEQGALRRQISGTSQNAPAPSIESLLATNRDRVIEWMRLCLAENVYPDETWPPTAADSDAKKLVWRKLGAVAERALGGK